MSAASRHALPAAARSRGRATRRAVGDATPQRSLAAGARAELWPIARRVPRYLRLGWAILREPAIPMRYKTVLYGAIAYQFSPAQIALAAIPVVGQIDALLLFLVGLRLAMSHCPPAVRASHLERVGLRDGQLGEDLRTVGALARRTARRAGTGLAVEFKFAARVGGGVARRMARRVVGRLQAREPGSRRE